MSKVLDNLKYLQSHEWVYLEGNIAVVGITDYAQDSLGDMVYVEVVDVGTQLAKGEEFGAVESVKAASDVYAPITGKVVEVNQEVLDNPELINEDAYANWLMKIEVVDENELDSLLDAVAYQEYLNGI